LPGDYRLFSVEEQNPDSHKSKGDVEV